MPATPLFQIEDLHVRAVGPDGGAAAAGNGSGGEILQGVHPGGLSKTGGQIPDN